MREKISSFLHYELLSKNSIGRIRIHSVFLLILFLVKLSIFFFDFLEGQITRWNFEFVGHNFSNVFCEKFCVPDLFRTRVVNWEVLELGTLKELSHRQPDDRLGAVRLFPSPVEQIKIKFLKLLDSVRSYELKVKQN